jgi:cytochrome c
MKILLPTLLICLLLAACGSGSDAPASETTATTDPSGLTAAQLEHGIGPITAFEPGPLDAALAERGAEVFKLKCSACHKMDARYVGPALGTVTQTRSPAYIMNMILNPAEMLEKHPEAKAKLAEFMSLMPNQNLTEDEARAILEYLRQQAP